MKEEKAMHKVHTIIDQMLSKFGRRTVGLNVHGRRTVGIGSHTKS
jgi:hypothetical protein